MNGPDHYRRAEQLIAAARKAFAPPPDLTPVTPGAPTPSELHQRAITEAQVHATLALAAATAGGSTGWHDVLDDPGQGGIGPGVRRTGR
jgi:hypothetical protein